MAKQYDHIISEISLRQERVAKQSALPDVVVGRFNTFTTTEHYSIKKLVVLHAHLLDLTYLYPILPGEKLFGKKGSSSIGARIRTQLAVIERILNLSDDIPSVVDRDELIVLNAYGYTTKHEKGRFYGFRVTMTSISRQCRYYLFKDKYYDVDLKNAHPTILLGYAQQNNIEVPVLERYVANREEFLKEIMNADKIDRTQAKTVVLIVINLYSEKGLSPTLISLLDDILRIRDHLYDKNLKSELTELGTYALSKEGFEKKSVARQKISLQSHYCTTEESKCLEVLREVCLWKANLDKEAKLRKESKNLSFIPFFDGAYIFSSVFSNRQEIQQIIDDTNKLIEPCVFEIKEIEPEWDYLTKETLETYEAAFDYLSGLSSSEFLLLIDLLGLPSFSLENKKLDSIIKRVTTPVVEEISDTTVEEQHENSGTEQSEKVLDNQEKPLVKTETPLERFKRGYDLEFNDFLGSTARQYKSNVMRRLTYFIRRSKLPEIKEKMKAMKENRLIKEDKTEK